MDTLERLILSESVKDRNLRYPRIRRIVRASKMLSLRTVTEKAQAVQDSIKGIEDEKTIIQLFDRLNLAVSDEYKKSLPTN